VDHLPGVFTHQVVAYWRALSNWWMKHKDLVSFNYTTGKLWTASRAPEHTGVRRPINAEHLSEKARQIGYLIQTCQYTNRQFIEAAQKITWSRSFEERQPRNYDEAKKVMPAFLMPSTNFWPGFQEPKVFDDQYDSEGEWMNRPKWIMGVAKQFFEDENLVLGRETYIFFSMLCSSLGKIDRSNIKNGYSELRNGERLFKGNWLIGPLIGVMNAMRALSIKRVSSMYENAEGITRLYIGPADEATCQVEWNMRVLFRGDFPTSADQPIDTSAPLEVSGCIARTRSNMCFEDGETWRARWTDVIVDTILRQHDYTEYVKSHLACPESAVVRRDRLEGLMEMENSATALDHRLALEPIVWTQDAVAEREARYGRGDRWHESHRVSDLNTELYDPEEYMMATDIEDHLNSKSTKTRIDGKKAYGLSLTALLTPPKFTVISDDFGRARERAIEAGISTSDGAVFSTVEPTSGQRKRANRRSRGKEEVKDTRRNHKQRESVSSEGGLADTHLSKTEDQLNDALSFGAADSKKQRLDKIHSEVFRTDLTPSQRKLKAAGMDYSDEAVARRNTKVVTTTTAVMEAKSRLSGKQQRELHLARKRGLTSKQIARLEKTSEVKRFGVNKYR